MPNAVTLLRFFLLGPVCYLLAVSPSGNPWPMALLALWASTDWIDGQLARRLGQVSRTGEILDPIADRLGIVAVVLTLTFTGVVPWPAVAVIAATDAATLAFAGAAAARGTIHVSMVGKARTALLLVAVVGIVGGVTLWPSILPTMQVLLWAGTALHIVAGLDYIRRARGTSVADRP